jgi:hypothetical protein
MKYKNNTDRSTMASFGQVLLIILVVSYSVGCRTVTKKPGAVIGPFHEPTNYHLAGGEMPSDMRRVALLPLTSSLDTLEHRSGRLLLQETLYTQVADAGLFEVVIVPPKKLEALTGKPIWRMIEELPIDFIDRIAREYDCQGVLFSHLSVYKPYPPLSVGWRMGLVHLSPQSNNGTVVWEIDEVFNAGKQDVINSAIRNGVKNGLSDPELDYDFGLLNSPRRFGRYTAEEVVSTMRRLVRPLKVVEVKEEEPLFKSNRTRYQEMISRDQTN